MNIAKASHERAVFLEFAKAAGLEGDHGTAINCDDPKPDIYYPHPTAPRYFELGRLADTFFAREYKRHLENGSSTFSIDPSRVGYPQRDMLKKKLAKKYDRGGVRLDLVLYYDIDEPWLQGPIPPCSFEDEAKHVMIPILCRSMGPFDGVWYFERYRRTILWSYSPTATQKLQLFF